VTSMLLIADVGGLGSDCRWHVGDEAMLAADLAWLRGEIPGIDLVVTSTAPAWTRCLYGVRATDFLDFGDETAADAAREMCHSIGMGEAFGSSDGDALAKAAGRLRETLATVDSVLFCGAGNLSSAFPNRLYERIAAGRLAAAMAKPYAFSGQTVGPLTDEDAAQLRDVLVGAVFVGTRDQASAELLGALGVRAVPMQDDAMHAPLAAEGAGASVVADGTRRIGVTLHHSSQAQHKLHIASIADAIGRVAMGTDAIVRFIPHFRGPADRWSDLELGAELESRLPVPVEFMPWEPADRVRANTAACSLVISTRYHPLVFAACAGIPAIGLYQDTYHRAKFSGVLNGREACHQMFPANAEGSSKAAAAGLALAGSSPTGEVIERHRLMIVQDAEIRRNCLTTLGRVR
jgi:polysaccharide pyruvyl transferase WcaK-like protein